MSAVRANLVEPQAGALPEFGGLRDARVPQSVTPDVQADLLPELADDSEHTPRPESSVARLPALAAYRDTQRKVVLVRQLRQFDRTHDFVKILVCVRGFVIRILPAVASAGLVAPMVLRVSNTAFFPSQTMATIGPEVMCFTRPSKNGLPLCSP